MELEYYVVLLQKSLKNDNMLTFNSLLDVLGELRVRVDGQVVVLLLLEIFLLILSLLVVLLFSRINNYWTSLSKIS